jgi:rare lipoprotein A
MRRVCCSTLCLVALLAAGCATRAPAPIAVDTPAPSPSPPPAPLRVPDAMPKLEPIRDGGPNRPYAVLGESYTPLAADAEYVESGLASWYGRPFHGRRTASGEVYNMYALSAAHKTLPLPSYARVTNPANGRSLIVRINDRGPFKKGRVIDLSWAAAAQLDVLGLAPVHVERITPAQIASGRWRRDAAPLIDGDDPPEPEPDAAQRAPTAAGRGFWVQLGAFRERGGAMQLQQQAAERVDGLALRLAVFSDAPLHRVQAGPFATRDEAQRVAARVREQMLLSPTVIERR